MSRAGQRSKAWRLGLRRQLTECEFHHLHHHHPHHPLSVPHGPWERKWRQGWGAGRMGEMASRGGECGREGWRDKGARPEDAEKRVGDGGREGKEEKLSEANTTT